MTTTDLHKILDDENRKLSLAELKQVIYEMKEDAFNEFGKSLERKSLNRQDIRNIGFYDGEQNAFQIVLDLFEHCNDLTKEQYKKGDKLYYIALNKVYEYELIDISKDKICVIDKAINIVETFPCAALGESIFSSYIVARQKLNKLQAEARKTLKENY